MRLLVFTCLFTLLVSEGLGLGYHQDVGIPEAIRIQQKETKLETARILGGLPSQPQNNPYLAGLLIWLTTGQMSVCSGTLLNSKLVLTAAQCWYDGYSQGNKIQVVLGSAYLFRGMRREVSAVVPHYQFDPRQLINDLAVLTLKYNVNFGENVRPVILPTQQHEDNSFWGISARVSGYGKTSDFSTVGPNTVQHAVNVIVSNNVIDNCLNHLPQRPGNLNKVICTSGDNGWGTCGADLGGPLVVPNVNNGSALLIGVTSIQSPFGCQTGFATGYMRVASYADWISWVQDYQL